MDFGLAKINFDAFGINAETGTTELDCSDSRDVQVLFHGSDGRCTMRHMCFLQGKHEAFDTLSHPNANLLAIRAVVYENETTVTKATNMKGFSNVIGPSRLQYTLQHIDCQMDTDSVHLMFLASNSACSCRVFALCFSVVIIVSQVRRGGVWAGGQSVAAGQALVLQHSARCKPA